MLARLRKGASGSGSVSSSGKKKEEQEGEEQEEEEVKTAVNSGVGKWELKVSLVPGREGKGIEFFSGLFQSDERKIALDMIEYPPYPSRSSINKKLDPRIFTCIVFMLCFTAFSSPCCFCFVFFCFDRRPPQFLDSI